ncbi:CDP-glycerol:glycerophosphate glycerophosphotransferase [Oceanobacillus picturae]|uniref:CDP-glycerol:glycerophosphate glycerophosphotransferase n=1 Tax=Oceanobacillus picturae TaxID=171693 RepID=A0A0U9H2M5_9BACI|nr:CDP-glycerol glycerophosphotransferase family protein [Oceanobacillus picturae]GAQ16887.1 CDP-glycerol:glycerophosphate glycerophosphotransferase [Oceanobacillus picturae]
MKKIRLLPTIIVKYFLVSLYVVFLIIFKQDENKMTFASYRSNKIKDNLAYLSEEMRANYPEIKQTYLFKKLDSSLYGKLSYIFHMVKACFHLATSRYFVVDDYYFPIYVVKPRRDLEIIQLWHSAGALKKFGYSTVGKSFGPSRSYLRHVPIHGNYTKAYVSSKEVIPYFSEAFNMPKEKILPLGIPRTDYFYNDNRLLAQGFYSNFPDLKGRKIILYAPTFRGKSHYQEAFAIPFDVDYMEKMLQEEYVLLVHLHPYMQAEVNVNNTNFSYYIKEGYTIQELLMLTDVLITDYSTIFFDFSILERPIIFFPYDLEDYKKERDFYYEYEKLIPGPMVMDTKSLVEAIVNLPDDHEIKQFKDRFFDYQDGRATERIAADILSR